MPKKTNAMRILDDLNISYKAREYDTSDDKIDGISVAAKIGIAAEAVYKTLVTFHESEIFVFVVPVAAKLDLKKAANAAGVKKLEMLPLKELKKRTGYIHGGCTAIGMKKDYPNFIDSSALKLDKMNVSAGRVGTQIELAPQDLAKAANAEFVDLTQA